MTTAHRSQLLWMFVALFAFITGNDLALATAVVSSNVWRAADYIKGRQ